jgi:hypothetical protein
MDFDQIISLLPITIVGLAALVSLISFRAGYPLVLKQLSVLWVVNFLFDLAGNITTHLKIPNHWIYNIYWWIQYPALAYLYGKLLKSKFIHRCIRWFYFIFPLLVIFESIWRGLIELQTIMIVTGDIFMITLTVAYFRQLYLSEETEPITRDPWFWFSFGFLIHFGGTVTFLGMLNYLWQRFPDFTKFYYVYFSNTFTIMLNLLIIAGFLCKRNYQKSH